MNGNKLESRRNAPQRAVTSWRRVAFHSNFRRRLLKIIEQKPILDGSDTAYIHCMRRLPSAQGGLKLMAAKIGQISSRTFGRVSLPGTVIGSSER